MNTINTNKTNNKKKMKRKARIKGRRLPNNRKRRANIIRGKKIAAASAKKFSKRFTMLRQNGNSVRVTGRDLIYSIPDDLTSPIQDTNVITVIPANPAYWKGTRIAALASGYQNYRPILFKVTYIPMCAVTQQGNVIGGTIWDDGIDNNNLQQSLRTSNGGFMTQCYVPHSTKIRPKSNLQFNLYRMGGEFSTTSNPFIFIALAIGCKNVNNQRITPGYFYVTWSFELKNPIGSVNEYNNTGLITYANLNSEYNTTIINLDTTSELPFGSYINIENDNGVSIAFYNNTKVEIASTTPTWGFTSVSRNPNALVTKIPIIYTGVTTSTISLGEDYNKAYLKVLEDRYEIYVPPTIASGTYWSIAQSDTILLLDSITQNFGKYDGTESVQVTIHNSQSSSSSYKAFSKYIASKNFYVTELINSNLNRIQKNVSKIRYVQSIPLIQEQLDNMSV